MAMADPDDTPVVPPSPVENTTDPTFKVEGNFLSLYDLNPIFEALIAVAHTWYNLGLALGVHEPTLKEIEADYSKCRNRLREMLSHWLRNGSSITWQNIVRALCSQSVDQRKFAEEIAKSRGLILPVAATPKPFARTLSATEGVSPRTQQLSIRRSTSVPIVSSIGFNSPTPVEPSADFQWQWEKCDTPALERMSSPIDAAVHGGKAYFRVYRSRRIYLYNLTHGGWSKLVKCLVKDSSLVMLPVAYKGGVRFLLHTVGGIKRTKDQQGPDDEYTDDIYQFSDPACRQWTRSISYPKLKTKRSQVTVVFSDGCLIIAGGSSAHGPVNTVHVLIVTCQDKVWREVACLPYKVFRASGSVCNGMLYILGGYVSPFDPIRSACVATVSKLIESNSNDQGIFSTIKDLELNDSACVSFCNSILAIGGWRKLGAASTDQPKGTKLVHVYDTSRNIWKELKGQLSEPRCFAFAAAFEDKQKIMIVGGYDRPNGACTDSVEFSIIN